jgi:hypothetical protein
MKHLILFSFIFLTGCATYSKTPKPPYLAPLDLPIWHMKFNISNGDFAKKIVESNQICVSHDSTCYNYLEDYMEKK